MLLIRYCISKKNYYEFFSQYSRSAFKQSEGTSEKGTLFLKNIDTGDKITIAEDVNHFILHDDKILYSAQKYSKLYSYGLENCETTELYTSEKIRQFSVYEDEIFIIDEKDCLIKISFDGTENIFEITENFVETASL